MSDIQIDGIQLSDEQLRMFRDALLMAYFKDMLKQGVISHLQFESFAADKLSKIT